ncbi:tetratricopeptide (TPR) repeat protein [Epilithonimonas hungarica]|uniref:tetratricopeptide repeat-containing sensor histidine kinase n=1 Tax=Epilithonimonas hungarica TaxID=454006 RepID=UPI002780D968|nr:tetratricopeptide repeat-containing sensor histidine kinase [Epilithonimonas hungarica]MDP9956971.1 tetratricopeptide (TPR) repeat protein [Epilithonimonas hungarica]
MKYFTFIFIIFIYSCNDKVNINVQKENPFYNKAFDYKDANEIDSSFLYFYKAKDFSIQHKDNFVVAKCLANLAIIQETKGDYFGSQETALSALDYFNVKDSSQYQYLSINYNTLGITASKLNNFTKAIEFYEKAIKYTTTLDDKLIYQNNLANNYVKVKNYKKAVRIFHETLEEDTLKDKNYSRTLTNLAKTKWAQNPNYNPITEFEIALKIRLKEKDNWGLNSSYSHLADYYTKNNQDSALSYARKMYEVSRKIESPDDQIEALQKLISLENLQKSKQYFQVYQKLNDSLQTARNKAKNQFALIRYETEKNKADFLKAKAESAARQNKIIIRNIALIAAFITLVGFYIYLQKRQKRLQQEKLLEVKNTELKYSKKVHDKVANRIYQLMSQVENKEVIDRDSLLFGLENAYETSRDISYDNKEINENQSFSEQLHKMLDSYSSDFVKVIFYRNNEKLWEGISFQNKTEVYLVLQELMTNMKKHSQANIVSIKFSREDSIINISYTDNGIGIDQLSPKNGLQNMENRINSIGGTIIFDTETNNLLKINISFPV